MTEENRGVAIEMLRQSVAIRLQAIIEFLRQRGLSELDAINLLLDEAERMLEQDDGK